MMRASSGDETLDAVVSRFASEAPSFRMRVVNGLRSSVSELEAVRDALLERMRAGQMREIQIWSWDLTSVPTVSESVSRR